jgi:hypothetical protein
VEEKQCPFCGAPDTTKNLPVGLGTKTCGCLRLLDSVIAHASADGQIVNADGLLGWAEEVVRERVKRYGGVAK